MACYSAIICIRLPREYCRQRKARPLTFLFIASRRSNCCVPSVGFCPYRLFIKASQFRAVLHTARTLWRRARGFNFFASGLKNLGKNLLLSLFDMPWAQRQIVISSPEPAIGNPLLCVQDRHGLHTLEIWRAQPLLHYTSLNGLFCFEPVFLRLKRCV